ncbi:MAG: hypothetical protein ACYDDI_17690 [Candidatus Acidiferrales bacterium]
MAAQLSHPKQGVIQRTGTAGRQKTATANHEKQQSDTDRVRTALTQNQQEESQALASQKNTSNQDVEIQGKLVKYTKALVWVGALQGIVLLLTVLAIWRQANFFRNSERAWVLGDQIGKLPEINYEPGKVVVLWVNVPVKNFGRTVGIIRETSSQAALIPKGKKLPDEPEYKSRFKSSDALPPNVASILQVGIAANDFLSAKNGTNTLYIYGFARSYCTTLRKTIMKQAI